jgi:hypothetical protein
MWKGKFVPVPKHRVLKTYGEDCSLISALVRSELSALHFGRFNRKNRAVGIHLRSADVDAMAAKKKKKKKKKSLHLSGMQSQASSP